MVPVLDALEVEFAEDQATQMAVWLLHVNMPYTKSPSSVVDKLRKNVSSRYDVLPVHGLILRHHESGVYSRLGLFKHLPELAGIKRHKVWEDMQAQLVTVKII